VDDTGGVAVPALKTAADLADPGHVHLRHEHAQLVLRSPWNYQAEIARDDVLRQESHGDVLAPLRGHARNDDVAAVLMRDECKLGWLIRQSPCGLPLTR